MPKTRQENFEQHVRELNKTRGLLSEMQMADAARFLGADDPYPVGLPFGNGPVHAPATRAQIERANMREAQAAKAALLEAGIRQAEQGVEKKIAARQRNPGVDFRGGSFLAVDPERRALYDARLAEERDARSAGMSAASAELQQRLGGMGGGDMGILMRRDPRAAVALMSAQMNAEQAGYDRKSQSADMMTRLQAEMMNQAADRGLRGDLAQKQMTHSAGLASADREARLEAIKTQLLANATEGGLSRAHATATQKAALDAAATGRKEEREFEGKYRLTPEQAAAQAQKEEFLKSQLGILTNPDIADPTERLAALQAFQGGGVAPNVPVGDEPTYSQAAKTLERSVARPGMATFAPALNEMSEREINELLYESFGTEREPDDTILSPLSEFVAAKRRTAKGWQQQGNHQYKKLVDLLVDSAPAERRKAIKAAVMQRYNDNKRSPAQSREEGVRSGRLPPQVLMRMGS